jgi:acyl-CoA hydrolase
MKNEKSPQESMVQMTEMVHPQHTNALGTVFGGVIMSWVDIAAAICAQKHCERMVVTASIDDMHFLAPIRLGWIVYINACINYTSNTSCEIGVKITTENPLSREHHHTATAYVTMVALDSNRKPIAVPKLIPHTEQEKKRYREAVDRRKSRLKLKEKLKEKVLKTS